MKRILIAASVFLLAIGFASAHDEGECNGFFHTDAYCAYLENATHESGTSYIATVFLQRNSWQPDITNQYRVECGQGYVEKLTPPRRKTMTNQAAAFDRRLWNQVC